MATDPARHTTVIGPDTHVRGELAFDSPARILGTLEGKIAAKQDVHVGEGATCKASIDAQSVLIDGNVEGDVVARERVQLNAKARVNGDITAATLVVAEGATFVGSVRVGPDAQKPSRSADHRAAAVEPKPSWNNPASSHSTSGSAPAPTVTPGLDSKLAGLEARLASLASRTRTPETISADNSVE